LPTNYANGAFCLVAGSQYCYAGFYNDSGASAIVQLTANGLTTVNTWIAPDGDTVYSFVLSGNYLYADLTNSTTYSFIGFAKIDTSTMETSAVFTSGFNFTEQNCYYDNLIATNNNGDFIVAYWNLTDSSAGLAVLSSSDFSMLTNIEFPYGVAGTYYSDGSLYAIDSSPSSENNYVLQTFDGDTLALTSSVQLQEDAAYIDVCNFVVLNGYCYQGISDGDIGGVYQFDMTSGSLIASFSESSFGLNGQEMVVFTDGTNLYGALSFTDANALIIQIDPTTMNSVQVYGTDDTNGFNVWTPVLASVNGVEYALAEDSQTAATFLYEFNGTGSPTPTSPTTHGGGGGLLNPLVTSTTASSSSPMPAPVLKLNGVEIFGVVVAVAILAAVLLHYLLPKPKRRRR
jgi:hypothetical protein